jgi:CheY-like chemotaxis protein
LPESGSRRFSSSSALRLAPGRRTATSRRIPGRSWPPVAVGLAGRDAGVHELGLLQRLRRDALEVSFGWPGTFRNVPLAPVRQLKGYDVQIAHEGEAALAAARAYRPEVVLLDIVMPGLDGYEVARRLRKEDGCDQAQLIALTGYGQDEDRRRSLEAGFDDHLGQADRPSCAGSAAAEGAGGQGCVMSFPY